MPETVARETVRQLVAAGGQLVDVLPRDEYDELHIEGALSIPLKELGERAPLELERTRPVITYCNDFL